MIEIPLSKQGKHKNKYIAIVDDEDKDLAELNWTVTIIAKNNKLHYARKNVCNADGTIKNMQIHRVIMERMLNRKLLAVEKIDHINGNGLDNRRGNLRLATHAENLHNRRANKNNPTGLKGAYLLKRTGQWFSQIMVNRMNVYLGYFDTAQEAHEAYCKAADELHGEFANHGK